MPTQTKVPGSPPLERRWTSLASEAKMFPQTQTFSSQQLVKKAALWDSLKETSLSGERCSGATHTH